MQTGSPGAAQGAPLTEMSQLLAIISEQQKMLASNAATIHMMQAAQCAERLVERAIGGLRDLAGGQLCMTGSSAADVARCLMDGVLQLLQGCTADVEMQQALGRCP